MKDPGTHWLPDAVHKNQGDLKLMEVAVDGVARLVPAVIPRLAG